MQQKEICAESIEDLLPLVSRSVLERSGDIRLPYKVNIDPRCSFCRKNTQIYRTDHEYEHPEPTFIERLPASVAGLSYEQDYPGRSVVILREHETSMTGMLERKFLLYIAFMEDVSAVADAIYRACRPEKINYSILMNTQDHFHMHLVPRYKAEGERIHLPPVFRGTAEMDPGFDYRSLALKIRHSLPRDRSEFSDSVGKMIDSGLP